MATSTVLYEKGAKFDMDYYLTKHMPMVQEKWGPSGLKSWKVLEFPDDAPYKVQATLEWGSVDEFKAAASGKESGTVFGDVPNFSDKQPVVMSGPVVKSS